MCSYNKGKEKAAFGITSIRMVGDMQWLIIRIWQMAGMKKSFL